MRWIALGSLVLILSAFLGCSRPVSTIRGKVTYEGKAVVEGVVIFMIDNQSYPADIKEDGTYEVFGVPRGKVNVVVQVQNPRPPARANPTVRKDAKGNAAAAKDDLAKMSRLPSKPKPTGPTMDTAIPAKYGQAETSGLSIDLNQPEHEFNITLE